MDIHVNGHLWNSKLLDPEEAKRELISIGEYIIKYADDIIVTLPNCQIVDVCFTISDYETPSMTITNTVYPMGLSKGKDR